MQMTVLCLTACNKGALCLTLFSDPKGQKGLPYCVLVGDGETSIFCPSLFLRDWQQQTF